jgi:hypothetical protein
MMSMRAVIAAVLISIAPRSDNPGFPEAGSHRR